MSTSSPSDGHGSSTRPYLIRALHDWCTDNGFTPYLAVYVDSSVRVPKEYVKNNEIVLNIGFEATSALRLGNESIEFKARFGGSACDIVVPVDHVIAIYARENGQGMAFPTPNQPAPESGDIESSTLHTQPQPLGSASGLRLAPAKAEAKDKKPGKTDNGTQPQPPAGGGGGRPSLKRVK